LTTCDTTYSINESIATTIEHNIVRSSEPIIKNDFLPFVDFGAGDIDCSIEKIDFYSGSKTDQNSIVQSVSSIDISKRGEYRFKVKILFKDGSYFITNQINGKNKCDPDTSSVLTSVP